MRRWQPRLWLCVGLLWITPLAATQSVEVLLANEVFVLEYVADPGSREQGLMGRLSLPLRGGMLFDFPAGSQPRIWMRNMDIALDLLFVDKHGTIVDIYVEVPPCERMPCPVYAASRPLRFVLELPAGSVSMLGLQPGMSVSMPAVTEQPPPPY